MFNGKKLEAFLVTIWFFHSFEYCAGIPMEYNETGKGSKYMRRKETITIFFCRGADYLSRQSKRIEKWP